jgi:hypothetical protein
LIGCRKVGSRRNPAGLVSFSFVVVLHLLSTYFPLTLSL